MIELLSKLKTGILIDASQIMDMSTVNLGITKIASVTWSDSSLGLPEAGMVYTQATVPGYKVMVEGDNNFLIYHTNTSSVFKLAYSWAEDDGKITER